MAKAATAHSTSASSFSDILKTKRSEVERPSPMPVGDYVCVITGQPEQDKSKQKGTPFVRFTYKVLEAMESVDEDQLDQWLTNAKGEKKKLTEVTIKDTYYLTESALWRLEDMLKACKLEDEDMSIEQAIPEAIGCQLIVTMVHESNQGGTNVFAKVSGVAAVEE